MLNCLVLRDFGAEVLVKKEESVHVEEAHPRTFHRSSSQDCHHHHHRRRSSVVLPQEGRWNVVNAAVVWQRMLCILGDVNSIERPVIHHDAMKGLWEVWKMLKDVSVGCWEGGACKSSSWG